MAAGDRPPCPSRPCRGVAGQSAFEGRTVRCRQRRRAHHHRSSSGGGGLSAGGPLTTVSLEISDGIDDAWGDGVILVSTQTSIATGFDDPSNFTGGTRFRSVDVPNGTVVDSATFRAFFAVLGGSPDIDIYVDDVDDAALWASDNFPSNITKSTAVTSFSTGGNDYRLIDVAGQCDEIFALGGWNPNQDMRLAFFDTVGSGSNFYAFASLEHATLDPPQLEIIYTPVGGIPTLMMTGVGF